MPNPNTSLARPDDDIGSKAVSDLLGRVPNLEHLGEKVEEKHLSRLRETLEAIRLELYKLLDVMVDDKTPKDKRQKTYLVFQVYASLGNVVGQCLLADLMSWQIPVKVKVGDQWVKQYRRESLMAAVADDIELIRGSQVVLGERLDEQGRKTIVPVAHSIGFLHTLYQLMRAQMQMTKQIAEHQLGPDFFKIADKNGVLHDEFQELLNLLGEERPEPQQSRRAGSEDEGEPQAAEPPPVIDPNKAIDQLLADEKA